MTSSGSYEVRCNYRPSSNDLKPARSIERESIISRGDLDFKRPGTDLEPGAIDMIVRRVAKRPISYDQVLINEDF